MMMHRASSRQWLRSALQIADRPRRLELPSFLCPISTTRLRLQALSLAPCLSTNAVSRVPIHTSRRCIHMEADSATTTTPAIGSTTPDIPVADYLPKQCTGCGALSQSLLENQPGYFDPNRKAVRKYVAFRKHGATGTATSADSPDLAEEQLLQDVMSKVDKSELEKQGVDMDALSESLVQDDPPPIATTIVKPPLCDRCHVLLHNRSGVPIMHPTIDTIHETLLESPYKYNHVYHVLDAADFPMSLLPKINQLLDLVPMRTKNRRSKPSSFHHGQKMEMSFVITRADLLAPTKQQVDRLLPYLREVLRDALGRAGQDIRLGNISLVSSKRSWWTIEVKEDIWKRGGAAWLVGKANVGKSQLFEAIFPKGRMDWEPTKHQISIDMYPSGKKEFPSLIKPSRKQDTAEEDSEIEALKRQLKELETQDVESQSLLTPAPEEVQYPEMPLVSDLPGTTASPIRVPYGNGRGELIDLPGLERSTLDQHVREEHRQSLVMQSRIKPEQLVLKPGKSLVLGGGLIRITPQEPAPVILSYSFTPIAPHLTSTEKAVGLQAQMDEAVNVENIAMPGTGDKIKLAKSVALKWDVTKERTGPLTRRDAIGLKVNQLPYRVLAADILIDGVGWVEVSAQMRTKDLYNQDLTEKQLEIDEELEEEEPEPEPELSALERLELASGKRKDKPKPKPRKVLPGPTPDTEPNWPVVDVYSPLGKFIGSRRPMNGWEMNKPKHNPASAKSRPRRSMKGMKKLEKKRRREREGA